MFKLFQKYKNIFDYLPILLVTMLFVTETELEKHAVNISCQMCITIVTLVIFYILIFRYNNTKTISLIVAIIIWLILVYIKKKYIPN